MGNTFTMSGAAGIATPSLAESGRPSRWTFRDATDHVLDVYDAKRTNDRLRRNAVRAVLKAYRDFPVRHRWVYFERRAQIRTAAQQTSGTVAYQHSGGAYSRLVTLSGATWPSWAGFGGLILGQQQYGIEELKSTTQLTLPEDANPGSDVAAGASYTLYRSLYPIPAGARKMDHLVELARSFRPEYCPPAELLQKQAGFWQPQRPYWYTIRADEHYLDSLAVEFAPPPSIEYVYDFLYEARPRQLRTESYTTGTVSTTLGSAVVTGTGTAFDALHDGCVIRFSGDGTSLPTSLIGSQADELNPAVLERVIGTVGGATALTLTTAADRTLTDVKFEISDPLDMEQGAMLTAFWRMAEAEYEWLSFERREHHQRAMEYAAVALREAMAADNRNRNLSGRGGGQWAFNLSDWATPEAFGGVPI